MGHRKCEECIARAQVRLSITPKVGSVEQRHLCSGCAPTIIADMVGKVVNPPHVRIHIAPLGS